MKRIALIPARMDATRFPGKLMKDLGGRPVIQHTYQNTLATKLFDEVVVVTDHDAIEAAVRSLDGKVIRSQAHHVSGTDRIAEAAASLPDADVLVNVQGDEPFINAAALQGLLAVFESDNGASVQVASLMHRLNNSEDADNPNYVKVVTSQQGFALYFSRSRIPYARDADTEATWYRHIGIYAFRRTALLKFPTWAPTPLEQIEKLEQLRFLENGIPIKMVLTGEPSLGIDTPEDLEAAQRKFK